MAVTVLYFFQCEAGESLRTPNAFMLPQEGDVTFGHFLNHFPLQRRSLHFRFMWEDRNRDYMWLDITDPSEKLPMNGGQIMVKVLKLDDAACFRRRKILRYKKPGLGSPALISESNRTGATDRSQPPKPPRAQLDSRISPPPGSHSSSAPRVTPPPAAAAPEADILNFGPETPGIDSAEPKSSSGSSTGYLAQGAMSIDIAAEPEALKMTRQELAARREADIDEKVQDALEEKRERDRKAEKESEELELARAKHEVNLRNWVYKNNVKRDVRSLLANLHTVTWPGARWKQAGLGDLLEPRQVKLQYRKAMLIVHPDRCSSMDTETKFIAKRLFEGINEAYEEFLKKESV